MVRQDASGLYRLLDVKVDLDVYQAKMPISNHKLNEFYTKVSQEEARCLFDDGEQAQLMFPSERNKLLVYVEQPTTNDHGELPAAVQCSQLLHGIARIGSRLPSRSRSLLRAASGL